MNHNEYQSLKVTMRDHVAQIEINRPEKANAFHMTLWQEVRQVFGWVKETPAVRVAVISGAGKNFCAGIDLNDFSSLLQQRESCEGRRREKLRQFILQLQESFNVIETCGRPVLAAVHGNCVGAGVDLIAACCLRYCTEDSSFSIKEIDLAMTADVGSLQRLPFIIGEGHLRELSYTGRVFKGPEAERLNLVNRCFSDQAKMMEEVFTMAQVIASKSPLAIRGIKEILLYNRDHSVADSLNYVATWNASALLSNDVVEVQKAMREKRLAQFED